MNGAILTTFDPADPANKAETEKLLETIRAYAVTDAVKSVTCEKPAGGLSRKRRMAQHADALRLRVIVRCLVKKARLQGDGDARLCHPLRKWLP